MAEGGAGQQPPAGLVAAGPVPGEQAFPSPVPGPGIISGLDIPAGEAWALHPETTTAAQTAAAAIDDKKGLGVVLLDVSGLLVITDMFVIASGTSRRHVLTLAEVVEERLRDLERRPLRREGLESATWVLLDYGDVVVHLFDEPTRRYYDLERLWVDAPRTEFDPASAGG
jgi:ribosome-associated protein